MQRGSNGFVRGRLTEAQRVRRGVQDQQQAGSEQRAVLTDSVFLYCPLLGA